MEKAWKAEQLNQISDHTSIFKYIPAEIGELLYCDTDQPNSMPLSATAAKRKRVIAISICILVLVLFWSFLYSHYIWGGIITLFMVLMTIVVSDTTFSGIDYFVGRRGFATVSFSGSRDNITSVEIYLFKDMAYFFTGECVNQINYTYSNTAYYFSIFGKLEESTNQYHRIFFYEGSYNDKHPNDIMNPDGADELYCMLKMVEKVWTSNFVLSHVNDKKILFGILTDETLVSDAISISADEIVVYDTVYNVSNIKNIYTSDGNLVI